ncbi:MAG: alpha/beta hydrolase, partial [Pseudomonadota bacterium]
TIVGAFRGTRRLSKLFDTMVFQGYNKAFAPPRTPFDWLSRDTDEVDRYVNDPLCGGLSSYAMWKDIFGGLLEISSPDRLARVANDLPLLITGGDVDPVGGAAALTKLADAYRGAGHSEVTLTLYAGGRHEMLNETNRAEATKDWLDWIESALRLG